MNTDLASADAEVEKKRARSAAAADADLGAVDEASAGRVAGRTSMSHRPTTRRRGSRAGFPSEWFSAVDVMVDREEITVVGTLADESADQGAAAEGRISRFRADTRAARIEIAEEAEARYGRKVSWGAQLGDTRALFTHISVPVMTRLRQPERQVLDTLVDAGVARSRSEALSWAVKLVGEHAESWLADLRGAMQEVDKLRSTGPDLGEPTRED